MVTETITAFFTDEGAPATGLTPTIRIRRLDTGALVVTDASMTETGDGFYKYDFTTYDNNLEYAIRCDGGSGLADNERYTFGNSGPTSDLNEVKAVTDKFSFSGINVNSQVKGIDTAVEAGLVDAIWDELLTAHAIANSAGWYIDGIKDVTDKFNFDIADNVYASVQDAGVLNDPSVAEIADGVWDEDLSLHTLAGSAGENQNLIDDIFVDTTAIKAKTNNLPVDPASESTLVGYGDGITAIVNDIKGKTDNLPVDPTSETNATSNTASINANIDANEVKIDGIKAKTDNLPVDPASETNVNANEVKIDAVQSDVTAIKTETDKLTFDGSNNIQARVNDKGVLNDPSTSDIDTTLSGTHGAGSWETASIDAGSIADAVWDEDLVDHTDIGTMGENQNIIDDIKSETASIRTQTDKLQFEGILIRAKAENLNDIEDSVWEADPASHTNDDTYGKQNNDIKLDTTGIKAKTDNLPADPASESAIIAETDLIKAQTDKMQFSVANDIQARINDIGVLAGSFPTPENVADAVWDEDIDDHLDTGSAGRELKNPGLDYEVFFPGILNLFAFQDFGTDFRLLIRDTTGRETLTTGMVTSPGTLFIFRDRGGQSLPILSGVTPNVAIEQGCIKISYPVDLEGGIFLPGDVLAGALVGTSLTINSRVYPMPRIDFTATITGENVAGQGQVQAGSTATSLITDIIAGAGEDDIFKGMQILVERSYVGNEVGYWITRNIKSYTGATGVFEFDEPLTFTPTTDDRVLVLARKESIGTREDLQVLLGLMHQNIVVEHTWDGRKHVGSSAYLYDSKANANINGKTPETGLIAEFTLINEYGIDDLIDKHTMVKEP